MKQSSRSHSAKLTDEPLRFLRQHLGEDQEPGVFAGRAAGGVLLKGPATSPGGRTSCYDGKLRRLGRHVPGV